MMIILDALCAGALLLAATPGTKDYASLPPSPAETMAKMKAAKISLAQAIDLVQKDTGGSVRAASLALDGDTPRIELEMCTPEKILDVVVNAVDGTIAKRAERQRFPGEPVTGAWQELPSGVKFFELEPGSGAQPKDRQAVVKVQYTGWLVDGTKFDSSFDRGEAYITSLDQVVPGFAEGVMGMRVGGKRKLIIPFELGYGVEGWTGIPGRAMLIFDVELREILDAAPLSPETKRFNDIQAANQELTSRLKAGDLKGVAALYADDAVMLGPGGFRIAGRKAIDDYWTGIKHPVDWQLEILSLDGKDDLTHQIGRSVLTTADDQGNQRVSDVFFSLIWRRQPDGTYKVAVDAYWPPK